MTNLNLARSFLTALDEDSDAWCFQTFDDSADRDRRLIRQLHGSLEDHADELRTLNEQGAGVFVAVNETNGKGRTKADIQRIRALYVDLDGSPLAPVQKAATGPHIVVATSPGKFHAYWRVTDCGLDQSEPALKQLIARYQADPACCDRSRVLRLPGFYHRKDDPYLVQVIDHAPGEYQMADFGFQPFYTPTLQKSTEEYRSQFFSTPLFSSVGKGIPPATLPETEGQRNKCLFGLARHLKGTMPDATRPELKVLVEQWHQLALPVIGTKEFAATWADFWRGWGKVKQPHGAVMNAILKEVDMDDGTPESIKALGYGEKTNLLIRICKQLQRNAGEDPFFISARQAGELIGLHFTEASKVLYALVADNVLELVKRGAGKQASRYRYVWPE